MLDRDAFLDRATATGERSIIDVLVDLRGAIVADQPPGGSGS
jgi:hypothetical protein